VLLWQGKRLDVIVTALLLVFVTERFLVGLVEGALVFHVLVRVAGT
jgi:hypothetical protein